MEQGLSLWDWTPASIPFPGFLPPGPARFGAWSVNPSLTCSPLSGAPAAPPPPPLSCQPCWEGVLPFMGRDEAFVPPHHPTPRLRAAGSKPKTQQLLPSTKLTQATAPLISH